MEDLTVGEEIRFSDWMLWISALTGLDISNDIRSEFLPELLWFQLVDSLCNAKASCAGGAVVVMYCLDSKFSCWYANLSKA